MYIIAGLGNPGTQYEGTRHNTGFSVIDTIAEKAGIPFDFEKYHTSGAVVFDAKAVVDRRWVDGRL